MAQEAAGVMAHRPQAGLLALGIPHQPARLKEITEEMALLLGVEAVVEQVLLGLQIPLGLLVMAAMAQRPLSQGHRQHTLVVEAVALIQHSLELQARVERVVVAMGKAMASATPELPTQAVVEAEVGSHFHRQFITQAVQAAPA